VNKISPKNAILYSFVIYFHLNGALEMDGLNLAEKLRLKLFSHEKSLFFTNIEKKMRGSNH